MLDPDDPRHDDIETMVDAWKTARTPEDVDAARNRLHSVLEQMAERFYGPAAQLDEDLAYLSYERGMRGEVPQAEGISKQFTDHRGRLIEEVRVSTYAPRRKVLLSARDNAELGRLTKAASKVDPPAWLEGKQRSAAWEKAKQDQVAAEAKLDAFLKAHGLGRPPAE